MWSLAEAELQHRCRNCFAINYKQRVVSVGSLNLFFKYRSCVSRCDMVKPEYPLKEAEMFLVWEKNVALRRKTQIPSLGDYFSCFVYSLGMTFGEGERGLSWELLIVGVINLFNLLVSIGWAPGAFRHQVVLVSGHMIAKTKLPAQKGLDSAGGSSPVALS